VRPVLVDTSVWRRHFSGGSGVARLSDLLEESGLALTHPAVIGELVLGGLSQREQRLLERLPKMAVISDAEVLEFVHHRQLARKGIGWVDAHLLASALAGSAQLWTLDADLAGAAARLHIAFDG
jgi:predicted nucleic acid-binding protein